MVRPDVDVDSDADKAFGLSEDYPPFSSPWHSHQKHQILFAARGTLVLTTEERRWTLPPERAAWIQSGARHMAESTSGVELRAVYLPKDLVTDVPPTCCVFAVTPLAREMLTYAMRWGPGERAAPKLRDTFFRALAALAGEWIASEHPYYLPAAQSTALALAMRWVDAHLAEATVDGAAAAASLSVRTLSRRFEKECKTTFRAYLQGARMMRAMELLARPDSSVSTTAHAVGFQSVGAFTSAFAERCGETPSEYRARVMR